ncbi:MAG: secretin N-terminal domain-containing protein [Candidatus Brocadiia bacterium]
MKYKILVMCLLMMAPVFAQEPATPSTPTGGVVKYNGPVKLSELLGYIGNREQRTIIYADAAIPQETIFVITPKEGISVDNFLNMIDTLLRLKNVVAIRTETTLKVMRTGDARDITPVRPPADIGSLPDTDQLITQTIPLKYLDANTANQIVQQMRGKDTQSIASMDGNSIIVVDYASNIKRFYEILKQLDIEQTPYLSEVRILKNASSTAVKTALDSYVQGTAQFIKQKAGVPPARPFITVDERTSTIMIFALEKDMPQLLKLVEMLDKEAAQKDTSVYIYKLVNTTADDIAKIVLDAYSKQQFQPPARRTMEIISVTAEKSTNSLIIVAPPRIYEEMVELIKKLDVRKLQVNIEAAIGEFSYDKMLELGIELAAFSQPTVAGTNATNVSGAPLPGVIAGTTFGLSQIKPDGGKVPIPPTYGGLTMGLWAGKQDSIPFLLRAAKTDGDVNVKAAPSIVVNDNSEATITIGEKIPYDTKTVGPDGTVTGITFGGYLEAAIKLKIIPHISEDDYLRLEIDQTVDEFMETSYSDTRPGTTSRSAKTMVTIPNKNTVAIGGMKKEYKTYTVSKVPFLGDIPIFGFFFSKTKEVVREKYLWIFIKPEIIKNFQDLIEKTKQDQKTLEGVQNNKEGIKDKDYIETPVNK